MPSGWTRLIFEQFEFPFEVVYPQTLDAGGLAAKYDVLVFVDGAIPGARRPVPTRSWAGSRAPTDIPAEYRGQLGNITVAKTIPQLKQFVEDGGLLLAIGSSTAIAEHFSLPVTRTRWSSGRRAAKNGRCRPTSSTSRVRCSRPRSIPRNPLAWGMPAKADVFFESSPAFRLSAGRGAEGREAGGVVRQRQAAAQRVGLGPDLPREAVDGHRRRGDGQGPRVPVRARDCVPRPAARHLQAVVQRDLLRRRREAAGAAKKYRGQASHR